jgi:hypothetical protein
MACAQANRIAAGGADHPCQPIEGSPTTPLPKHDRPANLCNPGGGVGSCHRLDRLAGSRQRIGANGTLIG